MKGKWTKRDRQWSRQQYCRMWLFMLPVTHARTTDAHCKHGDTQFDMALAHTCSDTHIPHSAVDSRVLSPITAERGSAAWWEQTIWGICQVLVDSKQSTVKNALPWPGSQLPALLCSACSERYNPPSPRRNPSSSFHIVLFFAPADCCRLRVCCSRLSGCRRFACKAREGAATPRRLSPFTLPTVGEAVCRAGNGREKEGKKQRRARRQWRKKIKRNCVFLCMKI